jgi:Xaa-Pro dipeptidase
MSNPDVSGGPAARLERFRAHLAERGARAALISNPLHVFYLTGHLSGARSPAFLLLRGDAPPVVVAGAGDAPAVEGADVELYEDYSIHRVVQRKVNAARALTVAADRIGLGREGPVAVEAHDVAAYAESALGGRERIDIAPVLRAVRAVKDSDELECIRRSVQVTRAGHAAARQAAVDGATELEVYAAIQRACVLQAGRTIAFDGDFVSGERSWHIGGPPSQRVMRDGELFICDLFPTLAGYWADTTRTFAIGSPTAAQRELYDIVLRALDSGRRAARPGIRACDVYHEVRKVIADAGHADRFPHHAGHGIGLDPHESPMIIPGDDTELRAGMTITLEPGIYVEGVGGVRLEDNYIIADIGAEAIPNYPLGLGV